MPHVKANGIRLEYFERGEGEPLVLIMGLGAGGALWKDHLAEYSKHFRCIAIDNRGAGLSGKPRGPYTTKMMAGDVAALMAALGLKTARVAGISMGSAIAQMLALEYPELVRCLVLISSWARCDAYTKVLLEQFKKLRAALKPADFTRYLQLWIFTAGYYERHLAEMLEGQKLASKNPMPLHAFKAQGDACISHDSLDRLNEILAPALITVGSADVFTPVRFSAAIHERLRGSEMLVFPGFGHCHHWEDLAHFNAVTAKFLLEH